jgi:hypothetical protein
MPKGIDKRRSIASQQRATKDSTPLWLFYFYQTTDNPTMHIHIIYCTLLSSAKTINTINAHLRKPLKQQHAPLVPLLQQGRNTVHTSIATLTNGPCRTFNPICNHENDACKNVQPRLHPHKRHLRFILPHLQACKPIM